MIPLLITLTIIAAILYLAFKIDPEKCRACNTQLEIWNWRKAWCPNKECKLFMVEQ